MEFKYFKSAYATDPPLLFIAVHEEAVVGQFLCIPAYLYYLNETIRFNWGVEWFVKPEFRDTHVGISLAVKLFKHSLLIDAVRGKFCTFIPDMVYHGILLGDADGNWRSDYNGNPVMLKSGSSAQVSINLSNAYMDDENYLNVPVYCVGNSNVTALDLSLESLDQSKLTFVDMSMGADISGNTSMSYSSKIRMTSYSKVLNGVKPSSSYCTLRFELNGSQLTSTDLGTGIAFVNGNKTNVETSGEFLLLSKNNISENSFTAYPNPTTGNFTILLPNDASGVSQVTLYDMAGKIVYSNKTSQNKIDVNLVSPVSGLYLLKVNNSNQVYSTKIQVK